MKFRTVSAIHLGPTGNQQGTHRFLSLRTGREIIRTVWTELPMPTDVIDRVLELGRRRGMPRTLSFADRYGNEIIDSSDDDDDDDHDSDYTYDSQDDLSLEADISIDLDDSLSYNDNPEDSGFHADDLEPSGVTDDMSGLESAEVGDVRDSDTDRQSDNDDDQPSGSTTSEATGACNEPGVETTEVCGKPEVDDTEMTPKRTTTRTRRRGH